MVFSNDYMEEMLKKGGSWDIFIKERDREDVHLYFRLPSNFRTVDGLTLRCMIF